jgi:hypothetical protein
MVDLNKLYNDCNKVIKDLDPTFIEGAINWADLYCVEAYEKTNHLEVQYFGVVVSEAAPENEQLHEAISKGLRALDWNILEVITEW